MANLETARHRVDPQLNGYERISCAARRLHLLLSEPHIRVNAGAYACLDDLLGAIHALYLARFYEFVDRTEHPIEVTVLQTRALNLSEGNIRLDGKWAAGFYFNGCLFRLAAVYHRLLKLILGKVGRRDDRHRLREEAAERYPELFVGGWDNLIVSDIYDEVNTLKHTTEGLVAGRTVTFEQALTGLHELLDIAERWNAELLTSLPPA